MEEEEEGVAAVVDWLVAGTVADIAGVDILAVAVVVVADAENCCC